MKSTLTAMEDEFEAIYNNSFPEEKLSKINDEIKTYFQKI